MKVQGSSARKLQRFPVSFVPPPAFFVLIFGLLGVAASARAQVTTGLPPFGSFSGGPFDTVNNANLNVHFEVPIINKPGVGMPFYYRLGYDSSVWYPSNGAWKPLANWGWRAITEAVTGYVTYFSYGPNTCYDSQHQPHTFYVFNGFTYIDTITTHHSFNGSVFSPDSQKCTNPPGRTQLTTTATDGSGYTITAYAGTTTATATLTSPGGASISPPMQIGTGSGSVTDANGNKVSTDGSIFTDTLGMTALTVVSSPPTYTRFEYTAGTGQMRYVQVNYTQKTVQTNFGCSGINEFPATPVYLVSSIDLPDGTSYSFQYEQTPGNASAVTGRIASIILPTGGTISYSYSGGSNGITCADGSAAGLIRQTPDGSWSYTHSENGTAWATTITDPQKNTTSLNFQGIYETERQTNSSAGTLLETVYTCYGINGGAAPAYPCNSSAVNGNITQRVVTVAPAGSANLTAKTVTDYDWNSTSQVSYGLPVETDEYGYNGALGRKTTISYNFQGSGCSVTHPNVFDRPCTVQVFDGAGNLKAKTKNTYDANGNLQTQTLTTNAQTGATINRSFTYNSNGTVAAATDVNGGETDYTYATCGPNNTPSAFPATITQKQLSLTRSMTWDCNGGVLTSLTDENGQGHTTSYTYNDPDFFRLTKVVDPAGAETDISYCTSNCPGAFTTESTLTFNSNNSVIDLRTTLDGLGRVHVSQRKQSPSSSNYDTVETDYDALGRVARVTQPYQGTAGQTNSNAPATTTTYDALNRPLTITDGGGGTVSFSYTNNDVLRTVGPAPPNENTKQAQYEYNALGQLLSVCEITTLGGNEPCAQHTAANGFWTAYGYDVLNDVTAVTQVNAANGITQSRNYQYDGLGRLISESNPEIVNPANDQQIPISYTYDTDATCGTANGDLVKKVDAVGNTICYGYDALHRLTSISHPSGNYAAITDNRCFTYDSAIVAGQSMANAKGRLAEAFTVAHGGGCTGAKVTDLGFGYSARGEVSDTWEATPHSNGWYHVNQTYRLPYGMPSQLNFYNNAGGLLVPIITYYPDGEGRVNQVTASSGQNPVSSASYNVSSQVRESPSARGIRTPSSTIRTRAA